MMKKILLLVLVTSSTLFSLGQLTNGLVAQYYFNDGTANDVSGNNLNADFVSATLTTDRFGNANKAFSFDGTQYINVPYMNEFDNMDMTISLWFRSDDTNFGRLIALPYQSAQIFSLNYRAGVTPDGVNFYADYYIPPNPTPATPYYAETGTIAPDGTWHHIVGIRNAGASRMYIYLDCNLVDSADYVGTTYSPDTPLQIGRFNSTWGQYFTGDIDDIRIYDRVLNSLELDSLCNESNPVLSTATIDNAIDIQLFPNPATNNLTIIYSQNKLKIDNYQIYSLDGKLVSAGIWTSNTIDISSIGSGLYVLKLFSADGIINEQKFIKE